MKPELRRLVVERAKDCCEYCRMPREFDDAAFHLDHIIAKKHGGGNSPANLALACANCSLAKGSNIAALEPRTRRLTRLFHPRRDIWAEHFAWKGAELSGKSAVGRATVAALNVNHAGRVALRLMLVASGVASFPDT